MAINRCGSRCNLDMGHAGPHAQDVPRSGPTGPVFDEIRRLRKDHDAHKSHDPTCPFCCGDIT